MLLVIDSFVVKDCQIICHDKRLVFVIETKLWIGDIRCGLLIRMEKLCRINIIAILLGSVIRGIVSGA